MILYAAADLIWASKIKGTAEALGLSARPARNREMLAARFADSPVKAVLVDLAKGDEALELLRSARELSVGNHVRVLAWGPHVAKQLFQAAREAGADEVLTNGAMEHNLEDVLLRLGS